MLRLRAKLGLTVLLAGLALASGWPALQFGLVGDDPVVVREQLERLDSWHSILFPPADVPQLAKAYYRPMVFASYQADRWWSDSSSLVRTLHRTSLWLHVSCTVLLFWLTARFDWKLALASAGLFAVHPVHVDTIAAIVGRTDSLALAAVLGSALSYRSYAAGSSPVWLSAAAALFLIALLSKEVAIVTPLVWWLVAPERLGRAAGWASLLTIGTYALLRISASHADLGAIESPQLAAAIAALGWSARTAFVPWPGSSFVPQTGAWIDLVIGSCLLIGVVAGTLKALRRRRVEFRFGLLVLFVAALLPSLAVAAFQITYLPVAERYLYLPSAVSCLVMAWGVQRSARPAWLQITVLSSLIVIGLALTHRRLPAWRDELSFWQHAQARAPHHPIPPTMLANELQRLGRLPEARTQLESATGLASDPHQRAIVRNNLGSVLRQQGFYREAIDTLTQAVSDDGTYWPARYNLALAKLQLAQTQTEIATRARLVTQAREHIRGALALAPHSKELQELWRQLAAGPE
jgi:tetratricopeptide (TPR) repeat protein